VYKLTYADCMDQIGDPQACRAFAQEEAEAAKWSYYMNCMGHCLNDARQTAIRP
jgi:hypothetical protein